MQIPAKVKDITGMRYGMRVVIEFAGTRKNGSNSKQALWLVRCDCGDESVTSARTLRVGKSCGCHIYAISGRVRRLPGGSVFRNEILGKYKGNAKERGLSWNITDEMFDEITSQNCTYCGIGPSNTRQRPDGTSTFTYNGIDRVVNEVGYEPDNVVPCCRICNQAKSSMDKDDFIAWAKRVAMHNF